MDQSRFLRELAQQPRVDSIRASDTAGSGHPTSSMSAAELLAVLLDGHLRCDFERPDDPGNDRLVFSKGHASPLLYACLRAVGAIDDDELLSRDVGVVCMTGFEPLVGVGDLTLEVVDQSQRSGDVRSPRLGHLEASQELSPLDSEQVGDRAGPAEVDQGRVDAVLSADLCLTR